MKGHILKYFTILVSTLLLTQANAQFCTVDNGIINVPGFYPISNDIPCFVRNQPIDLTLQMLFNDSTSNSQPLSYGQFVIDSIIGLPCGINWTTDKQNATVKHGYLPGEQGCLRLFGTTNDPPGWYNVVLKMSVKIGSLSTFFPMNSNGLGLSWVLQLRVKNYVSDPCPIIDPNTTSMTPRCSNRDSSYLFSKLSGRVFYDNDNNGREDIGEIGLNNFKMIANSNYYGLTNTSGNYELYLLPGTYTVRPDLTNTGYTVTTGRAVSTVTMQGGLDTLAPIGVYPTTPINDISVVGTYSNFRPGFNSTVWLTVKNNGNMPIPSAIVEYTYVDDMSYLVSTPTEVSHDTRNNKLVWEFSNLFPGEERLISANFTLDVNVNLLGTQLPTEAKALPINGEININNNTDLIEIEVTGSFDPNDKTPYPSGDLSEAFIRSGEPLRYRIRFQNTGTDTAFNIVVRDTLDDTKFDVSSLKMLGASHNYNFHIDDGKYAVWEFSNILLPDSNVNEPLSHGYILFNIDLKDGLTHGDEVNNGAGIFFDFNPVVLTNVANSKVNFNMVEGGNVGGVSSKPQLFPNPVNGMLQVKLLDAETINIEIVDLTGKVVHKAIADGNLLITDISNLNAGMYIVRVKGQQGKVMNRKILIGE